MEHNRIIFIDYLKLIGLLCIILAHVCTNPIIFQIRNFDVPLMVIISGFLAIDSYKRSMENGHSLLRYYWKRIVRLLFPTWIFLIFFFISMFIIFKVNGMPYPYNFMKIIESFLLLDGIGYVWIIRVYLICAFLTPVIFYFNEKIKSIEIKFLILLAIYILYEIFVFLGFNDLNVIFSYYVAYLIPFGIIYILGMVSKKTSPKTDAIISILFFAVHVFAMIGVYLVYGGYQYTQIMKYPPTIYYISYSLFVSFLLLSVFKRLNLKNFRIIEFCSRSSLWIYLWHIFLLTIIPMVLGEMNWAIFYLILVICTIGVTYIQNRVMDLLESKSVNNFLLNLFRG